ncbi:MAG: hypothetical protein R2883_00030 [Caldisericia bacterium]
MTEEFDPFVCRNQKKEVQNKPKTGIKSSRIIYALCMIIALLISHSRYSDKIRERSSEKKQALSMDAVAVIIGAKAPETIFKSSFYIYTSENKHHLFFDVKYPIDLSENTMFGITDILMAMKHCERKLMLELSKLLMKLAYGMMILKH